MKRVLTGVLIAAAVAGAIAVAFITLCCGDDGAGRAAVKKYADTIKPLAFEGGRIVQEEIKPRLGELREGKVEVAQFQREAGRWLRDFSRIRREFAAAPRPERLGKAAKLYDDALLAYSRAIERFIAASKMTDGKRRDAALDAGIDVAEVADKIYDRARDELSKQMRRVGLQPSL